jgi:hypothetical protein
MALAPIEEDSVPQESNDIRHIRYAMKHPELRELANVS